jgi:hypothetical protein
MDKSVMDKQQYESLKNEIRMVSEKLDWIISHSDNIPEFSAHPKKYTINVHADHKHSLVMYSSDTIWDLKGLLMSRGLLGRKYDKGRGKDVLCRMDDIEFDDDDATLEDEGFCDGYDVQICMIGGM